MLKIVTIHGAVVPFQKNSNVKHFTEEISDGKKSLRMVSFDPKLRRRVNESLESSSSVAMKECQLKRAAYGDTLEICRVETSERHFE